MPTNIFEYTSQAVCPFAEQIEMKKVKKTIILFNITLLLGFLKFSRRTYSYKEMLELLVLCIPCYSALGFRDL